MLNSRTLKDRTQMLQPYKKNPSDSPITTLNHLIHCYDRTSKLLQTLDIDPGSDDQDFYILGPEPIK